MNWPNECKFSNPLLRELNWQMIRNQYLIYIHSLSCNTPNQFSFLQSWDICAAAEPIMLSLLCEDSYAIKILQKKSKYPKQKNTSKYLLHYVDKCLESVSELFGPLASKLSDWRPPALYHIRYVVVFIIVLCHRCGVDFVL